jgi:hypothetical protein
MAEISWTLEDPIVERITFSKDDAGFWNVSVSLQELHQGSLKEKVVKVRLIDGTKIHGTKDVAQILWPVAGSRQAGEAAKTTLTFNTASTERPNNMKLDVDFA